jgi:hypothetical protein
MRWINLFEALITGTHKNPKEVSFECRKELNKIILSCPGIEVIIVGYRA